MVVEVVVVEVVSRRVHSMMNVASHQIAFALLVLLIGQPKEGRADKPNHDRTRRMNRLAVPE